jgi:hypothetical protein
MERILSFLMLKRIIFKILNIHECTKEDYFFQNQLRYNAV